jgi:hypothetical protein
MLYLKQYEHGKTCRNIKNCLMFADKREKNKELSLRWKEQKKEHRT